MLGSSRVGTRARAVLVAGALMLPAAGSGCGGHSAGEEAGPKPEPAPVPVTVVPLERKEVDRVVSIEGTLRAWESVTVSAKKGGRVLRVFHDIGDRVKPGEPLVELDPVDADLAVQQAETRYLAELVKLGLTQAQASAFLKEFGLGEELYSNPRVLAHIRDLPAIRRTDLVLAKARQDYTRQQQLSSRGVGTPQDLQDADNAMRTAEAALEDAILISRQVVAGAMASKVALDVARQDRSELTVTAPEPSLPTNGDGKIAPESSDIVYAISKRMVAEGQLLKDGEAVYELVIDHPIRLWASLPERYSPALAVGQAARVAAMSRPGERFEGEVTRINPSIDPMSRTFQVEAAIPNPDGKLRPGGFAKGEVVTETASEAVVVPIESVQRFAGVTKIFIVEAGRAHAIEVETGRQLGRMIEVVGDDLPTGDALVVTTGQTKLAEETPVVIRRPGEEDAEVHPTETAVIDEEPTATNRP